MTKNEYLEQIKESFEHFLIGNSENFRKYDYLNNDCLDNIRDFYDNVRIEIGLSFSNCYNAYGLGNNNEYTIFKKDTDSEGFVIEKKIVKFCYTTGIYGGCQAWLEDMENKMIMTVGHAR